MSSETMHRIVELIESSAQSRPSPTEFEMAYQVRVAMDKIRFVRIGSGRPCRISAVPLTNSACRRG